MAFTRQTCLLLLAALFVPITFAKEAGSGANIPGAQRDSSPVDSSSAARQVSIKASLRLKRMERHHRLDNNPVIRGVPRAEPPSPPAPSQEPLVQESMPTPAELRRPCTVMESRESSKSPCWRRAELKDWCLPVFKDLDGINLLANASRYISSRRKDFKWKFLADTFRNFNSIRQPGLEIPHFVHNQGNKLGMRLAGNPKFKLFVEKNELPKKDLPDLYNFTTCAVVGSSRSMLNKSRGKEIDSHSVVFRTNQAPTKGYERWVGGRTDLRVTNAANSYFSENGRKTVCLTPLIPRPAGNGAVILLNKKIPKYGPLLQCFSPDMDDLLPKMWAEVSSFALIAFPPGLQPEQSLPADARVASVRSLQVDCLPEASSKRSQAKVVVSKYGDLRGRIWCVAGFSAVVFAVQLCQHVNIYGFNFGSDYYFDKVHNGFAASKNGRPSNVLMREPLPNKVRQNMADIRARRRAHLRRSSSQAGDRDVREPKLAAQGNLTDLSNNYTDYEEGMEEVGDLRRRLQAISRFGHPWGAEKLCTRHLAKVLPKVKWHS